MACRRLLTLCAALSLFDAVASESEQKPLVGDDNGAVTPAKVVLYPGSRTFPDDLVDLLVAAPAPCADDGPTATFDLTPDVCLSGEYYARDNIKILQEPACADGSKPKMMFYPNRRCTGDPVTPEGGEPLLGDCLWSKDKLAVPSYYWSLIFRCEADGAVLHMEAKPPSIRQQVAGPVAGQLRFHHPGECQMPLGLQVIRHLDPDQCLVLADNYEILGPDSHWATIEIVMPAICADGSRARLALYEHTGDSYGWDAAEEYHCNGSEMTLKDGIIDINDRDVWSCISLQDVALARGGTGKAWGVAFHCDGFPLDRPVATGQPVDYDEVWYAHETALVSHSVCATMEGAPDNIFIPDRAPTFFFPAAGACVNLPEHTAIRTYRGLACPDGTRARFAGWENPDCSGWPKAIKPMADAMLEHCMAGPRVESGKSYAFWCRGDGTKPEERGEDDRRAVFSPNSCRRPTDPEPDYREPPRSTAVFVREDPDKCFMFVRNMPLLIFANAKCANGTDAKIAVWEQYGCFGPPDHMIDYDRRAEDACFAPPSPCHKYPCSAAFWCDGFEDRNIPRALAAYAHGESARLRDMLKKPWKYI